MYVFDEHRAELGHYIVVVVVAEVHVEGLLRTEVDLDIEVEHRTEVDLGIEAGPRKNNCCSFWASNASPCTRQLHALYD